MVGLVVLLGGAGCVNIGFLPFLGAFGAGVNGCFAFGGVTGCTLGTTTGVLVDGGGGGARTGTLVEGGSVGFWIGVSSSSSSRSTILSGSLFSVAHRIFLEVRICL